LPQVSCDLQSPEQPSPETVLPSSQTSPRVGSRMPLPHTSSDLQFAEQPSPETLLPSSQTSPWSVSTTLLPHVSSDLQSPEQPSPETLLPSSHASSGVTTPLPQPSGSHTMLTHAPSTALPVGSGNVHMSPVCWPSHADSCAGDAQPPWPSHTLSLGQSTSG